MDHLIWFVLNGALSLWCWRIGNLSFEHGRPGWGWANVAISALNAATALWHLYLFLSPPMIVE